MDFGRMADRPPNKPVYLRRRQGPHGVNCPGFELSHLSPFKKPLARIQSSL